MTALNIVPPTDPVYIEIILKPLLVCKTYTPKFGSGGEWTLADYQRQYGSDPFYAWVGLDSPLLYAAHKAAGGMTSLYRQFGIGCERLFRQIVIDQLGLQPDEVQWSYTIETQKRDLDARIPIVAVRETQREIIAQWLGAACDEAGVAAGLRDIMQGAVFEVRQGYKSRDSKRQNADIGNAGAAYKNQYVPVLPWPKRTKAAYQSRCSLQKSVRSGATAAFDTNRCDHQHQI